MVTKKTVPAEEQAKKAEQALREAVHEELKRKSKLGQYAVIYKDGRPLRVPASELINSGQ